MVVKGDIYKRIALAKLEFEKLVQYTDKKFNKIVLYDNFSKVYAIGRKHFNEMVEYHKSQMEITEDETFIYTRQTKTVKTSKL